MTERSQGTPSALERILLALRWLRAYDRTWLLGDVVAGVTLAAYLAPAGLGDATLANLSDDHVRCRTGDDHRRGDDGRRPYTGGTASDGADRLGDRRRVTFAALLLASQLDRTSTATPRQSSPGSWG